MMRKYIPHILFIVLSMNVLAQSEYDCINRKEFYILKSGSDIKSPNNLLASDIKSSNSAEKLFGPNYKAKAFCNELSLVNYTQISFDDGLELKIPDDKRFGNNFLIISDKYTLYLLNGKAIRVGMSAGELKAIFPKSYSKREIITNWKEMEGKTSIMVYFSFIRDGKVYLEDAWIVFILSKENGILEQIRSVEPD